MRGSLFLGFRVVALTPPKGMINMMAGFASPNHSYHSAGLRDPFDFAQDAAEATGSI